MSESGVGQAVLVAGGTGFIGAALCERLMGAGFNVTVLTRNKRRNMPRLHYVTWAPKDMETASTLLAPLIAQHRAIVNLAGKSIASGRWNDRVKRRILDSRLQATQALVRGIELAARKPELLINASAVGYYGSSDGGAMTEANPPGEDFLASVCRQWEQAAQQAETTGIRVIRLRIGVVLGRGGGALAKMILPFKLGLGGPLGSGRQKMSWIHLDDLTRMIGWLLVQSKLSGAVNAVAPNAATNREFSKTLAGVLHRPCLLRAPAFVIRLALGEASDLLLGGQDVRPQAVLDGGFRFQYPELKSALSQLASQ